MRIGIEQVVFGHMHEDHSLELALVGRLPPGPALVIASGGDLAFALAGAKMAVIAVDSNSAQIELMKRKMQCSADLASLCFCGRVDLVLRCGGPWLAWLFGWPKNQVGRGRGFLSDWLERFLPQVVTRVHGARASARLNRQTMGLIRRRLERAMRQPEAAQNPLLQVLFGKRFGAKSPEVWSERGIEKWRGEIGRIECKVADIAQLLGDSDDASFALISVSNLPDLIDAAAWDRLVEDAARTLISGGYLIVRSMLSENLESQGGLSWVTEENPTEDASPLCPVIWVGRKLGSITTGLPAVEFLNARSPRADCRR